MSDAVVTPTVASWPSPARRIPGRELLTEAQIAEVRERSPWRGIGMIAHAWAVILGAMALAILWPNPLTVLLAIIVIGSRQLGLAILMHDGAHGAFVRNERLNLALSQWLCAYPILAETRAYRRYHLKHHAHTQTEKDPDLVLSAPFPVTRASYRRKLLRDITGQTGFQQRRAQLMNALGPAGMPAVDRVRRFLGQLGPQLAVNAMLLGGLALVGAWWAYPVLWLLPLLTWFQVVVRVRNLSPGGMLAEGKLRVEQGAVVEIDLRNIGPVGGRVVWAGVGKFGIAFDHPIDPQAVRRQVAVPSDLPPHLRRSGLEKGPFYRRR